jgi:hypothetical protein
MADAPEIITIGGVAMVDSENAARMLGLRPNSFLRLRRRIEQTLARMDQLNYAADDKRRPLPVPTPAGEFHGDPVYRYDQIVTYRDQRKRRPRLPAA